MAGRVTAKLAAICLCVSLAAPACFSSASLVSGYMSLNGDLKDLIKSDEMHSLHSRTLLQTSSSEFDPTPAELAYCFPYYYVYGFYGDAYVQCLIIVQGAVTGTGEVEEECYDPLIPLYSTFTPEEFSSGVADYNLCLFTTGYSLTPSAQEAIQSSTIPAIYERVGPGTEAYDEYLATLGPALAPSSDEAEPPSSDTSDTTLLTDTSGGLSTGMGAASSSDTPSTTPSSFDASPTSPVTSDTPSVPATVTTDSGPSTVNSDTGGLAGIRVPDWGRRLLM